MDLGLYMRVLWRFRLLVLAGLLLAIGLAFLSVVRVSPLGSAKFQYREQEQWMGTVVLLVTEHGFPEARSVFPQEIPSIEETDRTVTPQFGPSGRFIELANLYAQLVTSDPVRWIMLRDGPVRGGVQAFPMVTNTDAPLPLVAIQATAPDPAGAQRLAERVAGAFKQYIADEQRRTGIPEDERVLLQIVKRPDEVELVNGRAKTLPIAIFLTVMLAVTGLAFILENLRPRVRVVAQDAAGAAEGLPSRRTA